MVNIYLFTKIGGEEQIRTVGQPIKLSTPFQGAALSHSATSPKHGTLYGT